MNKIYLNDSGLIVIKHKPNYINFEAEIFADMVRNIRQYKYLTNDIDRELVSNELVDLMKELK